MQMKIGMILDGTGIRRWQAEALLTLECDYDFVVYSCESNVAVKRRPRHALYYVLNLFTVRNRLTRRVALSANLAAAPRRSFRASCDGAWQQLPPGLLEAIREDAPAMLIKFGMGLLKVPPPDELAIPILSYHHGDPARFRGRPAAFHELLQGETTIGQIVQILSNQIDAGKIVAAAETKAIAHSYRATLIEVYRHSPLLLRTAVTNAVAGVGWEPPQWGRVYRLPGTVTVLRFLFERACHAISHLFYGLFREKRWRVATVALPDPSSPDVLTDVLSDESRWRMVPTPRGYRFLADPFFHPEHGLLVEGVRGASCRGEILQVTGQGVHRLSGRGGHFSYPAPIESEGRRYLLPEMSEWATASAFPLSNEGLGDPFELRIPGRPRLLDPTPFRFGDTFFLFGNVAFEGQSVLRLWVADGIANEFVEHPASPIRISPNGARMAGTPLQLDGRIIRVGQDLRRGYGDGIALFDMVRIDRTRYAERLIGEFKFLRRRGPHTLNIAREEAVFDHYTDAFSPLAGLRRLKERRAARRIGD